MKSFEDNTHAFVVRIWLEPRELEGATPQWRGVIEHVASDQRRSINNLNDIIDFISPYLEKMDVKRTKCRRAQQWLDHVRLLWKREI